MEAEIKSISARRGSSVPEMFVARAGLTRPILGDGGNACTDEIGLRHDSERHNGDSFRGDAKDQCTSIILYK